MRAPPSPDIALLASLYGAAWRPARWCGFAALEACQGRRGAIYLFLREGPRALRLTRSHAGYRLVGDAGETVLAASCLTELLRAIDLMAPTGAWPASPTRH